MIEDKLRAKAHELLNGPLWSAYWGRCIEGHPHESRCDAIHRALVEVDREARSELESVRREAADAKKLMWKYGTELDAALAEVDRLRALLASPHTPVQGEALAKAIEAEVAGVLDPDEGYCLAADCGWHPDDGKPHDACIYGRLIAALAAPSTSRGEGGT